MTTLNVGEQSVLLIQGYYGDFVPSIAADQLDSEKWGLNDEDLKGIRSAENPDYIKAWNAVLAKACYVDDNNVTWILHQDSRFNLFALSLTDF